MGAPDTSPARLRLRRFLVAIVASLLVPASATAADLRLATAQPVVTVNPFVALDDASLSALSLAYDRLVEIRPGDLQPDLDRSLAREVVSDPDGIGWTFRLRPDVVWSDGDAFDAEDVRFSIEALQADPSNGYRRALQYVVGVDVVDAATVHVRLALPDPTVQTLAIPVLPSHVWAPLDQAARDLGDGPLPAVTTGPYRLVGRAAEGVVSLDANERFRLGPSSVDAVTLTPIPDATAARAALSDGTLDAVLDGGDPTRAARAVDGVTTWSADIPQVWTLVFNSCRARTATCAAPGGDVRAGVVQDVAVRRALAYAVDRRAIAAAIGTHGAPAPGLVPVYYGPTSPSFRGLDGLGVKPNLSVARRALRAGGWRCGRLPCQRNGVAASFDLAVDRADETAGRIADIVARAGERVGILVDVRRLDESDLSRLMFRAGAGGAPAPGYEAVIASLRGDAAPESLFSSLESMSPLQIAFYSSPELDALLALSLGTVDPERLRGLIDELERLVLRDLPYVPLASERRVMLTSDARFRSWHPSPAGDHGAPLLASWSQVFDLEPVDAAPVATSDDPAIIAAPPASSPAEPIPAPVAAAIPRPTTDPARPLFLAAAGLVAVSIVASAVAVLRRRRRRTGTEQWEVLD